MEKYKWIAAICFGLTAIAFSCKTKFETTKATTVASTSPQAVERGKVLVYSICAGCHYNHGVNKFIGNRIEDVPGIVGKVYSANLTKSKSHGIPSKYTDAQIKYLIKTGVAYDGRFIPYMLRPNMADEDLNDIVDYLRSDDPALAAADTTVGLTSYTPLGKTVMGMKAKPLPNSTGIKRPSENEPVALGRYLVDNLGCFHCHSKNLTSLNYLHPEQSKGYLEGGFKLKGEQGADVVASNITPDKQTGIGNYTKQDFLKALKDGQAPDRKLKPPMPKFQMLSDGEVGAIYAYIQTVPPKDHKVKN
ncbi:MAG TPA: c-type cytochrome [Mucilaginibacter sp.]|jgi:mono/diheme cytochrome c family protein